MANIHPTAIIHESAQLHESVQVGPFCIIEAGVEIGEGSILESSVRIHRLAKIGKNNRFCHCASIGSEGQDLSQDLSLPTFIKIGDNNIFREFTNFQRGTKVETPTIIGNNGYFMGSSHAGHDCVVGNDVVMVHGAVLGGHVTLQDKVMVGGLGAVHQHVTVGEYAMIGGVCKITKDLPPYTMADGSPADVVGLNVVGLKRAGFGPEMRSQIKATYKTIYHSGMNFSRAIAELKKNENHPKEIQKIIEFFEKSERGVLDHR